MLEHLPIGPVIDLANPGRARLSILADMRDRGEITAQQYEAEARAAGKVAGEWERARADRRQIVCRY